METAICEAWRRLPAHQRDILVTLALDGPGSGVDLHERVGGVDGRQDPPATYRHLTALREAGLVGCEEVDGRKNEYATTVEGMQLLHESPIETDPR